MARKKFPLLENIEITAAGAEGKAVAKHNNMVVFVPYGAPGDIVDIQIIRKKKTFFEGRITKFHHHSSLRSEPFCEHYGLCGGCSWQHVDYLHQLEFKRQQVVDSFQRIGKFEFPTIPEALGSHDIKNYRNKLEFTFSNRRWLTSGNPSENEANQMLGLGFHLPRLFDRILDINTCFLQPEPSNRIRLAVKAFAIENQYGFYDHRRREGLLRNLIVRNSNTGEVMVILVVNQNDEEKIHGLLNHLKNLFPEITSLMYVINSKLNDSFSDLDAVLYSGKPYITEVMEDLSFRIGPLSFFQTNSSQALQLYRIVREMAALTGSEIVYDLYTGTGTIANFIAKNTRQVIGIEYVVAAVGDAVQNASLNRIENVKFVAGDMAKVLNEEFVDFHGRPDVVITDPPRAGMHENVVRTLLQIRPERIVYVSCNPATQARDLAMMTEAYEIVHIQPVDMFPHTQHIENVVNMKCRKTI